MGSTPSCAVPPDVSASRGLVLSDQDLAASFRDRSEVKLEAALGRNGNLAAARATEVVGAEAVVLASSAACRLHGTLAGVRTVQPERRASCPGGSLPMEGNDRVPVWVVGPAREAASAAALVVVATDC